MPPKKKRSRAEVEKWMELRKDAITDEKIHPTKHIVLESPDKTLKLYYNISTLIRIAETKGELRQPPHFMEKMKPELVKEIEEKEGRTLRFARPPPQHQQLLPEDVEDEVQHAGAQDDVFHYFFEYLSTANCYVCPACFDHVRELQGLPEVIDPLEVLEHVDRDDLPRVVFPKAAGWRRHIKHHGSTDATPGDFSLRQMVMDFIAKLNARSRRGRFQSTNTYWNADARWNVVRYNRILSRINAAAENGENVSGVAYSNVKSWYEGDVAEHPDVQAMESEGTTDSEAEELEAEKIARRYERKYGEGKYLKDDKKKDKQRQTQSSDEDDDSSSGDEDEEDSSSDGDSDDDEDSSEVESSDVTSSDYRPKKRRRLEKELKQHPDDSTSTSSADTPDSCASTATSERERLRGKLRGHVFSRMTAFEHQEAIRLERQLEKEQKENPTELREPQEEFYPLFGRRAGATVNDRIDVDNLEEIPEDAGYEGRLPRLTATSGEKRRPHSSARRRHRRSSSSDASEGEDELLLQSASKSGDPTPKKHPRFLMDDD